MQQIVHKLGEQRESETSPFCWVSCVHSAPTWPTPTWSITFVADELKFYSVCLFEFEIVELRRSCRHRCTWGLRLGGGSEIQIPKKGRVGNLHMQIRQNYGIYANFGLKYRIFSPNMQIFQASGLFSREAGKSCPPSDHFREVRPHPIVHLWGQVGTLWRGLLFSSVIDHVGRRSSRCIVNSAVQCTCNSVEHLKTTPQTESHRKIFWNRTANRCTNRTANRGLRCGAVQRCSTMTCNPLTTHTPQH